MAKIKKILINGMMLMVKKISLLGLSVLVLVSQSAFAADSQQWFPMATGQNVRMSAKGDSFRNINGSSSLLVQYEDTEHKTVEYYKVSVKNSDCDNGYGKLNYFDLDGKFITKVDYVSSGRSVGAEVGDFICGVRKGLSQK
ncbi:hypothetical protein [Klebsiella pneumoniae]|uniref:hypothetical protein n=2 Tax=Klebsiella pneumoniae TaxID=573 RepID=UPI002168C5A3|nr:hypothetical protein [Klebsiella pneumoniae]